MPDRTRSNGDETENSKPTDGDGEKETGGYADRPRASVYERRFHSGRGKESYRNTDVEIDGEEWSVDTLVDLERLRRERSDAFVSLLRASRDPTRVVILRDLLLDGPQTYEELSRATDKTERTVKNHVYELDEAGVVEIIRTTEVHITTVSFVDDEVRLLASDVLSFLS